MPQTSRRDGIKRLWKIEEKTDRKVRKRTEREKKMKINLKKCFTPMTPPIPGTIVLGVHVIGFHVDRY